MSAAAMIELSRGSLTVLALLAAFWLVVALAFAWRGARRAGQGGQLAAEARAASALLAASPAIPLIVARNGAVDPDPRLLNWLGIERAGTLDEFGLAPDDTAAVGAGAAAAGAGQTFSRSFAVPGSGRILEVSGGPAPPGFPSGTALLWFQDITESETKRRRLAEEGNRAARALDALSALIEAAPFPMWHRGPDLRLTMVNGAYVAAVEAPDAMAVVEAGTELADENEGREPLSEAAAVRDGGEPVARTVPATIGGERRMVRIVEVPLGEAGIAGYAIDVEDREQAKADLARFVRAQRDMLDRLSAGVAQFGRDRGLIFFNQPFARLFSLKAEWLADRPEFDRVIDRMRESGRLPEVRDFPAWKEEKRGWFTSGLAADEEDWLLPGGKHLHVVAQPLPDGGLLLIFEDRTEQIQLASARDTLLRVRTATFDNLFEAVGVFASDGRLNLWNNRFRELWDFEEEQLAEHPRVDALTPLIAKKLKNPNHAGLVRELVRSATVERKQRGGRVSLTDGRDFEFAAVPLPDGNALFTMLDITDSRIIETALRERNEALEEADRLKTAFVSNMSYELRTPLTSIGGFAEMLAGGYAGELPPTAADYVKAILESVGRLGALIDDVLDLTQSESGGLLLAEEDIDLQTLCTEAAEETKGLAARKRIDFAVEADPSVGRMTGDRRRLRQSLDNLLKNAFAYTDEGGRVLLRAEGTDEEATIIVSDNGKGIAPADQSRVFDRFNRQALGGGEDAALGLGLPLARQFVEAHGGRIELQSDIGKGTTVILHLPRKVRHA